MKSRLLLDVVVRKRAAIFQLLASEDEALLVRRDSLLPRGDTERRQGVIHATDHARDPTSNKTTGP